MSREWTQKAGTAMRGPEIRGVILGLNPDALSGKMASTNGDLCSAKKVQRIYLNK